MHGFEQIIRSLLDQWGYVAIFGALLGESAGLPLPGETILVLSSFLAHKGTSLHIQWVILVGIAAAVLGDNIGFYVGRRLGPRLLRWLGKRFHLDEDIEVVRYQIRHHGRATVFWARYIFGLRTITGPVAGALGMEWKEFLLFNVLGAASWVMAIGFSVYAFADVFHSLLGFLEKLSWVIAVVVFTVGFFLWRHKKKALRRRQERA
ncbi:MAG: DedA family protein [Acidobacteriaceae bacterium]